MQLSGKRILNFSRDSSLFRIIRFEFHDKNKTSNVTINAIFVIFNYFNRSKNILHIINH